MWGRYVPLFCVFTETKLFKDEECSDALIANKMAKSYWSEDRFVNAVIKGDCINVMQHLPDGCIDMVLCDLPYGTTQNKWDSIVPLDKLWLEYKRIVKPNGAIVLTSQGLFTAALIMSQPKLFKYKWVWEKSKPTNFLNAKKQP